MTTLPTPAELREDADHVQGGAIYLSNPKEVERCNRIANAMREYADLKDAAERGVTDEVVTTATAAYLEHAHSRVTSVANCMRSALLAVAPHLALMTKREGT